MEVDVVLSPALARCLISNREAWPTVPNCYGSRSNLPVCFRLGSAWDIWWTPDGLRHCVLISRRICAVGGLVAVAADVPPPGLADDYAERFGEWAGCREVDEWYSRHGGHRRRILSRLCPDQEACKVECPPIPNPRESTAARRPPLRVGFLF